MLNFLLAHCARLLKSCLVLSSTALLLSNTASHADQVTIKRVSNTPTPSPAALAQAKPLELPLVSPAQLKARGLLNESGTLVQPSKPTGPRPSTAKIMLRGNPGGPPMPSIEVFPAEYLKASAVEPAHREKASLSSNTVAPMNYGDSELTFSTSRVEITGKHILSKAYPYRAVGKLYILNSDGTIAGHCSASLIAKGILVTAAHCVSEYATGTTFANWIFYPGFFNGRSLGKVSVRAVVVPNSYLYGGGCLGGIVCVNDVALVVLAGSRGKYIGSKTGWLGVGVDYASFNSFYETHVTQLGYPGGLDYGNQMIRNDAEGFAVDETEAYNTIIGSQMNGGSSGGPWIANFGIPPVTNGVGTGYYPNSNVVIGVSSWGYPYAPVFRMGASPFDSSTLYDLYSAACTFDPLACAP